MGVIRTVLVGILVLLLTISLVSANLVVGVERTVLDGEFVKTSLEEEGTYDALIEIAADQMNAPTGPENSSGMPISPDEVIENIITPEYIQGQAEANIDRGYAYLHGNRDDPGLALDFTPVKSNADQAIRAQVENMTTAELFSMFAASSPSTNSSGFDLAAVGRMTESEQAYREEKRAFRDRVRQRVVDSLVDEAMATRSDDELLALVVDGYDPSAYSAAEKAEMVQNREDEIRTALESLVEAQYGDEIDEQMDDRMVELQDEATAMVAGMATSNGTDPGVTEPLVDMVTVSAEALTTDMSYSEYRPQVEDARQRLDENISTMFASELSEGMPDRMDLTEEIGRQSLEQARTGVRAVDTAAVGLPLLAVLLAGLLWLVSRSLAATSAGTGVGMTVAGASGYAAATLAPAQVESFLPTGPESGPMLELATAITDRVFATFATQSAILLAAGLLFVALAFALRLGVFTRRSRVR